MIKIENVEVVGFEHAIRGMRNPMNSWEKSDSGWNGTFDYFSGSPYWTVGPNDMTLMKKLAKAGTEHRKYMRMIVVYLDITAPLYWWKEFDTYKVGTVANSCSTMHKIAAKEFTLEDFSYEHLVDNGYADSDEHGRGYQPDIDNSLELLKCTIETLNHYREKYVNARKDNTKKQYWWQMIQLLPTSYNQKRTIMLNYEVLANIYRQRKGHKLDEWNDLCAWIETLPYSDLITGKVDENGLEEFVKSAKNIDSRIDHIVKEKKSPSIYSLVDDRDYVLYGFDFSRISFGEALSFIQKWEDRKDPEE